MNRHLSRSLLLLVAAMLATANLTYGQTAEVTGRVTDRNTAVVPGTEVSISSVETGVSRKAVTNDEGYYTIPLLQPGAYQLTVRKEGFKPVARDNVALEVGQTARLDFTLEAGNVNEVLNIVEQSPLLSQETSSLGQVIDGKKITNIPLNGRSPFRLVQLTPGVLGSNSANGQFGDIPVNTTFDSNFSINGGRSQSNEVTIDGVPSTAGFFNQITTIPSVEAAQEFKVESNNVSAEYGRFGGGMINVSTRSGGKDLHGTLYEFLRNDAFDANDFFNNRAGREKPPFRMNQFGGSISGPVWLPKRVFGPASYDGRHRTFFFADYQGTRWRRGDVFFTSVPTELERRGDFSQTRDAQGRLVTIFDPLTTRANPNYNSGQPISATNTPFIRTPFAGNVIPQDRLDPIAREIIKYYPLPNNQGQQFTNINNFASNAKRRVDGDQYSARVDHHFSESYRTFVRFSRNESALTQPDYFNNVASPNPGAVGTTPFRQHTIANDHTVMLSPTTVLNFRYGYARWFQSRVTRSFGFDQTTLGFPAALVAQQQVPVFPLITAEGYSNLGGQSYFRNGNDTHSLLGSVTKLAGKHALKFGGDARLRRINFFDVNAAGGTYNFTRSLTGIDSTVTVSNAGNGIAGLLLGAGGGGSTPVNGAASLQNFYVAGYAQDDLKVTSKLTLNLGLRYEVESPYTERYDRLASFDPLVPSPARNAQFPNITGGLVYAGADERHVYDWDLNNWGPRLGFAYSVTPKTVVRGGGGVFFSPLEMSNNAVGFIPTPGFSASTPWQATTGGRFVFRTLRDPYPQGLLQPVGSSQGASTFISQGLNLWDPDARTPYVMQWNLNVQRELPWGLLVDVAYAGNRGVKLTRGRELNALDPQYLALGNSLTLTQANPFPLGAAAAATVTQRQLLLPFPQFTSVNLINNTAGNSVYHALQAKVDKRFSGGVNFLLAYTFGKLISDVNNQLAPIGDLTNVTGVQNFYDLRAERAVSEMDRTHSLAFSYVVELPIGRDRRFFGNLRGLAGKVLEGWQVNGVARYDSGVPLAFSAAITGGGNRPNWTGASAKLDSDRPRGEQILRWFDTGVQLNPALPCAAPANFCQPPAFSFGNAPRTFSGLRGPSYRNVDFSLIKVTRISETVNLQFRSEFFNVFNIANFALPNTNINNQQYGQITATSALPRVIQFALKLGF